MMSVSVFVKAEAPSTTTAEVVLIVPFVSVGITGFVPPNTVKVHWGATKNGESVVVGKV